MGNIGIWAIYIDLKICKLAINAFNTVSQRVCAISKSISCISYVPQKLRCFTKPYYYINQYDVHSIYWLSFYDTIKTVPIIFSNKSIFITRNNTLQQMSFNICHNKLYLEWHRGMLFSYLSPF